MPRNKFTHSYDDIISLENLLEAWKEFQSGKKLRKDVQEFELHLMSNILSLHHDLVSKKYQHSLYEAFNVSDPKPRSIHKASVRDRLLHHSLYRTLYPFFDKTFVSDSFSCRKWKGTHRAINRFRAFGYKVSKNHTKTAWVLKGDIRKFFASIDHTILMGITDQYIIDPDIRVLLSKIITSFSVREGVGLPLGNLTSQILVNIYMNEFDQFVKHSLKEKYYVRYADDFVILSDDKSHLENIIPKLQEFLWDRLKLELHPNKLYIKTIASGIDFLGWILFPDHRVLRSVTKRRMFRGIREKQGKIETVQSYIGITSQGNGYKLRKRIETIVQGFENNRSL
jgi:RNA-directed DNA polymerase